MPLSHVFCAQNRAARPAPTQSAVCHAPCITNTVAFRTILYALKNQGKARASRALRARLSLRPRRPRRLDAAGVCLVALRARVWRKGKAVRQTRRTCAPSERRLLRRKGHASARTRCHVLLPEAAAAPQKARSPRLPRRQIFSFFAPGQSGGQKKEKICLAQERAGKVGGRSRWSRKTTT